MAGGMHGMPPPGAASPATPQPTPGASLQRASDPSGAGEMPLSASVPDDTTLLERAQHLFREFDTRYQGSGPGCVTLEQFRDGLKRFNTGFSEDTELDLFQKLCGPEGHVTFEGFQNFAEWYPTILNCLYFRAKDFWNDVRQRQAIQRDEARLRELLEGVELARLKADEAARDEQEAALCAAVAERAAQDYADSAGTATDREAPPASTKAKLEEAHDGTIGARDELSNSLEQLEKDREAERAMMQRLGLDHAQQDIEEAAARVDEADAEADDARERLEELQQLVETMREELARREETANNARENLTAAQDNLRRLAHEDPTLDALKNSEERVVAAEGALHRRQEEEEAIADAHRVATALAAEKRAEADEANAKAAEVERAGRKQKDQYQRALRAAEDMQARVQGMEQANNEFNERRAAREEEERPVLRQEVKLREQRECLEQMEAVLRDKAGHIVQQAATMPTPSGPQWRDDRSLQQLRPCVTTWQNAPEHTPMKPAPLPGRSDNDDRRLMYMSHDHVGDPRDLSGAAKDGRATVTPTRPDPRQS